MSSLLLSTQHLQLVTPDTSLIPAMLEFLKRNEAHLAPWSPPAPATLYADAHWQEVVSKSAAAFAAGQALRLWMTPTDRPDHLIGTIGFSQIARGPFCSAVLGYQIDAGQQGRGLMYEALQESLRYMFTEQKLHRIGANYRPENVRSGRLLARLGFRVEGFARNYLFIDGDWRDHILTSVTNDAFEATWLANR